MSVKSIFRAYDVRGVYGKELTEEIMEKIGNALARFLKQDTVVLGMDGRKSSNSLKDAFSKGFVAAGKNVNHKTCYHCYNLRFGFRFCLPVHGKFKPGAFT